MTDTTEEMVPICSSNIGGMPGLLLCGAASSVNFSQPGGLFSANDNRSGAVPRKLQMNARSSEVMASPSRRREAPTKRDSSRATPLNGSGTDHPNRNPNRIALAPSKASDQAQGTAMPDAPFPMSVTARAADEPRPSTALIVEGLRPRQVIAAGLLASGKQGREVAATLGIAPETLSRWKAEPEFQNAMRQLLREHIDSMQLGMIALTGEAIGQLHNLLNSFSDRISLQACSLVLSRAAPIIGLVGEELRRPQPHTDARV